MDPQVTVLNEVIAEQKALIETMRVEIESLHKQLESSLSLAETAIKSLTKVQYQLDREHGEVVIN